MKILQIDIEFRMENWVNGRREYTYVMRIQLQGIGIATILFQVRRTAANHNEGKAISIVIVKLRQPPSLSGCVMIETSKELLTFLT